MGVFPHTPLWLAPRAGSSPAGGAFFVSLSVRREGSGGVPPHPPVAGAPCRFESCRGRLFVPLSVRREGSGGVPPHPPRGWRHVQVRVLPGALFCVPFRLGEKKWGCSPTPPSWLVPRAGSSPSEFLCYLTPPSPKFNRLLPEVLLSLASPPTAGGGDLLSRLPRRLGYLHALPTPGLQGGIVSPIIRPRLS